MHNHRVLIVEDHDGMRMALRGLFRMVGWEVHAVATVAEALAALDSPHDCALVDLNLPDGEGEAIIRKVKAEQPPTCVTVICTATADEARIKAVEALGPQALLRKPVEFADLFAACTTTALT